MNILLEKIECKIQVAYLSKRHDNSEHDRAELGDSVVNDQLSNG